MSFDKRKNSLVYVCDLSGLHEVVGVAGLGWAGRLLGCTLGNQVHVAYFEHPKFGMLVKTFFGIFAVFLAHMACGLTLAIHSSHQVSQYAFTVPFHGHAAAAASGLYQKKCSFL